MGRPFLAAGSPLGHFPAGAWEGRSHIRELQRIAEVDGLTDESVCPTWGRRFRLPTDLFTASQGAVGFYSSHGKAVMRSFAAPYGTSVTVSSARLVVTGLTGNTPGESSTSVHCGSRRAFVAISTGAASAVYGCRAIAFSVT